MKVGVIVRYQNMEEEFKWMRANGIDNCQMYMFPDQISDENVQRVCQLREEYQIEITSLVGMWTGTAAWNFSAGPVTLGLIPPAYRDRRMAEMRVYCDLAARLGIKDVSSHMGFIPEYMYDANYREWIPAMQDLMRYYEDKDIYLDFETGQETPITMLRAIKDIGSDRLGVNFDSGNLILYGKANPVDALDILGPYVRGVHAKDALYPTDPVNLGEEKALGEGKVNFDALLAKLREVGYTGAITIERECAGDKEREDILKGKALLDSLLS
ncbi:MAG: sugar phosphate isomerase/epimerase [Clostridiales bacterium]|nr:sugar phosphate isomerase/epimerase [Clostridiales bacterium]